MSEQAPDGQRPTTAAPTTSMLVLGALLVGALAWTYWPALNALARKWSVDARYSHGFLVPGFALFLLWLRWDRRAAWSIRPHGWGLVLLALGIGIDLASARVFLPWLEYASMLVCLSGLAVLVGGWPMLRWTAPAIGFLVFMIPLPYRVENALGAPLQRVATVASTATLQTVGLPAVAEGNVITLAEGVRVGVVDACNGLGMLMMFFAYATGAALVIQRPLLDRALVILSAIPIALLANITRISMTGLLYVTASKELAEAVYHDLAGWLMMPFALGILWLELWLLDRLFVESAPVPATVPVGLASEPMAARRAVEGHTLSNPIS